MTEKSLEGPMKKPRQFPTKIRFFVLERKSRQEVFLLALGLCIWWIFTCLCLAQMGKAVWWAFGQDGSRYGRILASEGAWLSWPGVILTCLFALVIAAIHWRWGTRTAINRTLKIFRARKLDPGDPYHQLFRNTVEEMCIASGNPLKVQCRVIPCLGLNGLSLRDPGGLAVVAVTEGLLARTSRDEIQAVAAQLTGQVLTGDALISTVAYSLFGALREWSETLLRPPENANSQEAAPNPMLILAVVALRLLLGVGSLFNLALSRERVFRSDALAAQFTRNPFALAKVLRRLSRAWRGNGTFGTGIEAVLFVPPGRGRHDEHLSFFGFLFRAHPPLRDRLLRAVKMTGAGLEAIDASLRKPEVKRASVWETKKAPKASWWIYERGDWQGPYPLAELKKRDLTPFTLVVRHGGREIQEAAQDSVLAQELFGQKDQSGGPRCPVCGEPLHEGRYEGVRIHACLNCGGKLVSQDGMPRILARRIFPVRERLKERARKWLKEHLKQGTKLPYGASPFKCPLCHHRMTRSPYNLYYVVEVDRCAYCNVVWFDEGELELLQALVEDAQDSVSQR